MAYIGKQPLIGNFQVCDAISTVNGQAAYTLQVGGANVSPETANNMIVSVNGVIQKPNISYTVSGSTITFTSNLVTGDVIDFIQILGNVLDLGVPSDNTVTTAKIADGAVTATKLASGVGGKVLQVVNATDSTERTTTSTSFVTGSNTLSVDITPSSTSNKILVIANCGGVYVNASAQYIYLTIFRDATNIGDATYGLTEIRSHSTGDLGYPTSIQVYDSPASTSSLTYQVYFRTTTSTGNLNTSGALASITAMEIQG